MYRSSSEVKLPEKGKIDSPSHHHNNSKAIIRRYIHRKASIKPGFRLLLVELSIKGYEFNTWSESREGAIDADAALVALIIDIFYEHPQVFADEGVAAGVQVDLVKLALSLGQITAALLD